MELSLIEKALLVDREVPQPLAVDRGVREPLLGAVHVTAEQVYGGVSERDRQDRGQASPAVLDDASKRYGEPHEHENLPPKTFDTDNSRQNP
jgi:hypothetical protein